MTVKLGKKEYQPDERTLHLANFIDPIAVPAAYDFDLRRASFPLSAFGNDEWGNCVKVGQANQLVRFERLEQRRTLKLTPDMVVNAYKDEVERQFGGRPTAPGAKYDEGLVVIANLRNWRTIGWPIDFTKRPNDTRVYTVSAFGELEPLDFDQLKAACYLLHGIHLGFWLPLSVRGNLESWDFKGETGAGWQPGSWGGHLVYAKAYSDDEFEIITWGMKVRVTRSFIAKYCDEAWAVVDDFDHWRRSREVDVDRMKSYLREIGASGIE